MENICVVNYSNGAWYPKGQKRLIESLYKFGHTTMCMFGANNLQCPSHQENPYAFKIYSILKAYEMGYKKIFWMDSSAWIEKPLNEISQILDKDGIFLEHGGERVGTWTNDFTLNYFGLNRDEALEIPVVVAGICGFNFNNVLASDMFNEWKQACDSGCFKGKWTNTEKTESKDERVRGHRHDLSSLSIIAFKKKAPIQKPHTFLHYVYPSKPFSETATIFLQGM